jgi:hypothetical protein
MKRSGAWPSRARSHLRSHLMTTSAAPVWATQDWMISGQGKAFAFQAGVDLVDHVVSVESVFMVT